MMELTQLDIEETRRIYTWGNGDSVTLNRITHFKASTSTHRLKTADGNLHIIPAGWIHIEILCEDFTL